LNPPSVDVIILLTGQLNPKGEHNMNLTETMPSTLTRLRTQKGVTQEEAAASFGVSNKTVSKWETGASLPETEYLTKIADYYGITVNELFGRETVEKNIGKLIRQEYYGLNGAESIVKSFRLAHDVVLNCAAFQQKYVEPIEPKDLFNYPEYFNRSLLACYNAFELLLNSRHANMVVMLAGNDDNFNWLTDKAEAISPLLKFLSEPDALRIFKLIHTRDFPVEFTASYMAETAGISEARTTELLDEAVRHKLCGAEVVHLKDGETKLYSSDGNGYILSALTLLHEWVCGSNRHYNAQHGAVKLIKGGETA
jgi:transcriptional regulator with XRE-family HTH domain